MKLYVGANSFEKFRQIASFLKDHNIHPSYVRIEKVRFPGDELRELEEKVALTEYILAQRASEQEHEDYRVLVEAKSSSKSIIFTKDAGGIDVFYSKKNPLDYREPLSEYVVKYHSRDIQQLSCREDAHELKLYTLPSGSVSFDQSPAGWILGNSLFRILKAPLYRKLLSFDLNERGMFLKIWSLEQQKNYWSSSLNGGLPVVKKKDVIHEGTFMLHDMFHFIFQDPIISGNETPLEKNAYITYRMMSEAFTQVLADMLSPLVGDFEAIGYDTTLRRIFPLAKSLKVDLHTLEGLLTVLHANCVFTLFGDDSEYVGLGADPVALENFKKKYSVFFSVDFQWNKKNIENEFEQISHNRKLRTYFDDLPSVISNFSAKALCAQVLNADGTMSFEALFKIFWSQLMEMIGYTKKVDLKGYTQTAVLRYVAGQMWLVYQHYHVPGSKELVERSKEFYKHILAAKDRSEMLSLYQEFIAIFNTYVDELANRGVILAHERVVFKLHVPHFKPVFYSYDKPEDSYEPLQSKSAHILGHSVHRAENSVRTLLDELVTPEAQAKYIGAISSIDTTHHHEVHKQKGQIIVISGPSGVGKDTIINAIVNASDFVKFPAYTTRPKRPREVDGLDYRFVSKKEFFNLMRKQEFLDYLLINGNYYGTPLDDFADVIREGKRVVLHLGVQSALLLKKKIPNVTTVFLLPPTKGELVSRLQHRGMSAEQIGERIQEDPNDYTLGVLCDLLVVNYDNEAQTAASRVLNFISEKQRAKNTPFLSTSFFDSTLSLGYKIAQDIDIQRRQAINNTKIFLSEYLTFGKKGEKHYMKSAHRFTPKPGEPIQPAPPSTRSS